MRHLSQCLYVHDALAGMRTLALNGSAYTVEPRGFGLVDLTRVDTGECYGVTLWSCGCRDWQYRRPAGGCKHQLALLALGLIGEPERTTSGEGD